MVVTSSVAEWRRWNEKYLSGPNPNIPETLAFVMHRYFFQLTPHQRTALIENLVGQHDINAWIMALDVMHVGGREWIFAKRKELAKWFGWEAKEILAYFEGVWGISWNIFSSSAIKRPQYFSF
jgi:hypothetical protein